MTVNFHHPAVFWQHRSGGAPEDVAEGLGSGPAATRSSAPAKLPLRSLPPTPGAPPGPTAASYARRLGDRMGRRTAAALPGRVIQC